MSEEEVEWEVIEEERKFLGLLGQKIRVRGRPKHAPHLIYARKVLEKLLELMGVDASVKVVNGGLINIEGKDAGLLIGKRGITLRALEEWINMAISKKYYPKKVELDAGGYKEKRKRKLRELALKIARKVEEEGKSFTLEPMAAWERRIIHMTLKNHPRVYTVSVGGEPYRRVVISPK
ncbi:MAG: Putative RNA-binding protein [bacterium 42_11]|nr:MAG: Putative RNA-binding protein [bacterium 42_11]